MLDSLKKSDAELSGAQRRRGQQRYISRCHVGDICQVLLSSMGDESPDNKDGIESDRCGSAMAGARSSLGHGVSKSSRHTSSSSSGGHGAATGGDSTRGEGGGRGCVSVFNVVDDEPASRETVEAFARQLLLGVGGGPANDGRVPESEGRAPESEEGGRESEVGFPKGGKAHDLQGGSAAGGESSSGGCGGGRSSTSTSSRSSQSSSGESSSGSDVGDSRGRSSSSSRPAALEEKRVINTRIKRRLGVRLLYPTYREGLSAIAAGDAGPFTSMEDVWILTGRPLAG